MLDSGTGEAVRRFQQHAPAMRSGGRDESRYRSARADEARGQGFLIAGMAGDWRLVDVDEGAGRVVRSSDQYIR
jgi:hypothetical protein